ncbi:MAG: hypothetical protein AABN33_03310 [Acidobacteriota bacterium]
MQSNMSYRANNKYTKPGDSGSLVLDQKTGRAVGLHFAGANSGSVFSPIDDVLNALGVKLVTKSIDGPKTKPRKKASQKSAVKASAKSAAKKSNSKKPGGKLTAKTKR